MSRCSSSLISSRHFSAEMDSTRLANAYIQLMDTGKHGNEITLPTAGTGYGEVILLCSDLPEHLADGDLAGDQSWISWVQAMHGPRAPQQAGNDAGAS